ncbi:MAG: DUF3800 domain-containing protein [bacterium]|nr:DUF3800 domain-containing protein [bacterium]
MKKISQSQLERLREIYYLYLDESGHATFKAKKLYKTINERYLTIGGMLLRGDLHWTELLPRTNDVLTRHFGRSDAFLHFTDMNTKAGVFSGISDEARASFWEDFLDAVASVDCTLMSITIDKQRMQDKFKVYLDDPYHLLIVWHTERVIYELTKREKQERRRDNHIPGLMAKLIIEARNEKSDQRLKRSYRNIYENGSKRFITITAREVQSKLISSEIAILQKEDRNLGLQVADMLCNPLHWTTLLRFCSEDIEAMRGATKKSEAVEKFWQKLGNKIAHDKSGKIEGYGIKLFPMPSRMSPTEIAE